MKRGLALVAALVLGVLLFSGCSTGTLEDDFTNTPQEFVPEEEPPSQAEIDSWSEQSGGRTCVDVTSIDNNWDNDVLCTRRDGVQFYTSYEGADRFLNR